MTKRFPDGERNSMAGGSELVPIHYCAATGPVATATFSPKGNWGDLSSVRSLKAKDSFTGSTLEAVPVDPFSDETLNGKSDVDCEDLGKGNKNDA